MAVDYCVGKATIMEHKTLKRILVGLFFCVILFALSFLFEEKAETAPTTEETSEVRLATD
ncbi:hypothetical protein QQ020_25330 [Fulvivirgaceae bacterium BMA12]|uniref:Uncharacterized protein n=1 Tax=Agaribacillus aureus TaxID=3051825 RepID=A0ABT8LCB9_9BACT|nr:hypothetical protein [Fulvivirgaceae bacterium BMA12]